jgi:2-polyprenyl-3-methyl-5-hydroxy-6-metoxy-1,4-benzoquinol methylase
MLKKSLAKFYDIRREDSFGVVLRKKRLGLFAQLIANLPTPIRILDVGGNQNFWKNTGFLEQFGNAIDITIINIDPQEAKTTIPNIKSLVGDATNLQQFGDHSFDVVFSNSVIEHVGNYEDQRRMAQEVLRVGKRYFVQTPNFYFPIEPHFVFPFFQFLPIEARIWLVSHFDLAWYKKIPDREIARKAVMEIQLLSKRKFVALFPCSARLYEEKVLGLTKSFILYGGWKNPQ